MDRKNEMLAKYKSGKTLEEIGKEYGITRERVRQLLSGFPEYFASKLSKRKGKLVVANCQGCGEPLKYISYSWRENRKFHSRRCFSLFILKRNLTIKSKVCTRCGIERKIELYSKTNRKSLDRSSICKPCLASWAREYYRSERGKKVHKEYIERNKAKVNEYHLRYYHANKDKIAARTRFRTRLKYATDEKFRERILAASRKYYRRQKQKSIKK